MVGLHAPTFVGNILQSTLVERKKFGLIFFPGLINLRWSRAIMAFKCDVEDDCQFLGVHMRLSTRCNIWFTLGLFANYFSLELLSLSLKVTWMCSKVNWIVERQVYCLIWIINLLMGASLLALAKSIYYEFPKGRTIKKVMGEGGDFRAAGIFFRDQIPCMNFF